MITFFFNGIRYLHFLKLKISYMKTMGILMSKLKPKKRQLSLLIGVKCLVWNHSNTLDYGCVSRKVGNASYRFVDHHFTTHKFSINLFIYCDSFRCVCFNFMIYLLKYAQYNISNRPPKTIERNHKESYLHVYS